jgi:diguanylate cyclase (GGDEF)-like protein/PAS domain S-box-containing protein
MITIATCGGVLITVLALLALVDQFARSYAQRQATVRLQQVAWQMRDALNHGMQVAVSDVKLLSELKELRDAADPADMRRPMENMQRIAPNYAWIGVAGPDGTVYAATGKLLEGKDVSARPWFRDARNGVTAVDYHAAVLLEKKLPQGADPWRFVDVSIPVLRSDGSVRGIMGAHLSWVWARQLAETLLVPAGKEYQTEVLIVRQDGAVLLGPKDMEEKKLDAASVGLALNGGSGAVDETADGQRYLTGYAQTGLDAGYPSLKWAVLVRQPYKVAMADFRALQQRIVMVGLGLALLLGVSGMLFARRVSQPFIRLSSAMQNYKPQQPTPVPVIGDFHEAHLLSSTLAAMVGREQRYLETLKTLNENLEQTVQERTREIQRKAQELQRSLAAQEQIQSQLQESEAELRATLHHAYDAFIAFDEQGLVREWNGQAERLLGWSRAEMLGNPVIDTIVVPAMRATRRQGLRRFIETGDSALVNRRVEMPVLRRDGAEIPVEVSVAHVPRRHGHLFIAFMHDITERRTLHASLEQMALKDMLTDLPNRRALQQRLPQALARSARSGKPLAVFFLDLDGFKGVNDRYGHDAGDELLRILAQRIVATVRRTDTVARLAGDEFVVVLELLSHAEDAVDVAAKLLPMLSQPFVLETATVALSGSIGIALHDPASPESPDALLARADHAMYDAKKGGRNRYRIAPLATA